MTFADTDESFAWRVLRIMAEFVDGFEFLSKTAAHGHDLWFGPAERGRSYYQKARELGRLLAADKFTVVTGGGPGIMEGAKSRG